MASAAATHTLSLPPEEEPQRGGAQALQTWVIVAVAAGGLGLVTLVGLVWWLVCRRQNRVSRYELIAGLGMGAYGEVFLVRRRKDRRFYAMKYVACQDREAQLAAMREYQLIKARQAHPHMIQIVECMLNDGHGDRVGSFSCVPLESSPTPESGVRGVPWGVDAERLGNLELHWNKLGQGPARYEVSEPSDGEDGEDDLSDMRSSPAPSDAGYSSVYVGDPGAGARPECADDMNDDDSFLRRGSFNASNLSSCVSPAAARGRRSRSRSRTRRSRSRSLAGSSAASDTSRAEKPPGAFAAEPPPYDAVPRVPSLQDTTTAGDDGRRSSLGVFAPMPRGKRGDPDDDAAGSPPRMVLPATPTNARSGDRVPLVTPTRHGGYGTQERSPHSRQASPMAGAPALSRWLWWNMKNSNAKQKQKKGWRKQSARSRSSTTHQSQCSPSGNEQEDEGEGEGREVHSAGETVHSGNANPFRSQRYVCLVMPYYPDGDLKSYIQQMDGMLTLEQVQSFVGQLASVLDHLHTGTPPLIHRDLKPENVLIHVRRKKTDGDGGYSEADADSPAPPAAAPDIKLVVSDFGLAKPLQNRSRCHTHAGTLYYIAPECWKRCYGTEVDIWALGCIAYGISTKRMEHRNTRMMFNDMMRLGEDALLAELADDLAGMGYDPELAELTCSLLRHDPTARPTAREVVDRVGFVLREEYVKAY